MRQVWQGVRWRNLGQQGSNGDIVAWHQGKWRLLKPLLLAKVKV
jgi:uncharacterized protein YbdZ (MbtH family)